MSDNWRWLIRAWREAAPEQRDPGFKAAYIELIDREFNDPKNWVKADDGSTVLIKGHSTFMDDLFKETVRTYGPPLVSGNKKDERNAR